MERAAFSIDLRNMAALLAIRCLNVCPTANPGRTSTSRCATSAPGAGKGLRPALLIATCRAFGGQLNDALTSAAALELLHNAFLIHDDIQDQSESRRGIPCLHTELGTPLAINAGDAMMASAFRLLRANLADLGPNTAWRVFDEFDHLVSQSLEGQAMELGWIRDNDLSISPSDYLRMTLKKTCWYSFIHPCRIGALIARPGSTRISTSLTRSVFSSAPPFKFKTTY